MRFPTLLQPFKNTNFIKAINEGGPRGSGAHLKCLEYFKIIKSYLKMYNKYILLFKKKKTIFTPT